MHHGNVPDALIRLELLGLMSLSPTVHVCWVRVMMAGCCCAEACTAAVLIGVMRLPGCPFDSAWCLVCEVCRLTVECVDCGCFLSFAFLGGARRLELSPCNTQSNAARVLAAPVLQVGHFCICEDEMHDRVDADGTSKAVCVDLAALEAFQIAQQSPQARMNM